MGDKIKIKDIEGNAHEITDLCKNLGFDLNSYLNNKPLKNKVKTWVIITMILSFLVCISIIWIFPSLIVLKKILTILSVFLGGAIICSIHHNNENWGVTLISIVILIALMLITFEIKTPEQVIEKIETETTKKISS